MPPDQRPSALQVMGIPDLIILKDFWKLLGGGGVPLYFVKLPGVLHSPLTLLAPLSFTLAGDLDLDHLPPLLPQEATGPSQAFG